jgi:prostaglandin-endoperoxide synthase 2
MINGSEYPSRLFGDDGLVKTEFLGLKYVDKGTRDLNPALFASQRFANTPERKRDLFVSGLERGNSTIFYSAISTIFLREHNRLCREMAKRYPDWDDDRLFETARNTRVCTQIAY